MGFFDKLFGKSKSETNLDYVSLLSGYTPIYSSFGNNIYASDIVNQAINIISSEMSKLTISHVLDTSKGTVSKNSNIQKVLENPNSFMTQSDFMQKTTYLLLKNFNVFIYCQWSDDGSKLLGLYPLNPVQVEFQEDKVGTMFVKFKFGKGTEQIIPYKSLIHIRYFYSENELMGGDTTGNPDNRGLLFNLGLNHNLMSSLDKSISSSYNLNGIVKYNTMLDDGKQMKAIKKFEEQLKNSESGILPIDNKSEYLPIKKDIKLIDKDTLEFLDKLILRHFKVSLPILSGDYTKAQYESFYQNCIEPLANSFSEAFTKSIFTEREKDFGNKIKFYANKLLFMTVAESLEFANLGVSAGIATKNEIREIFGYPPLADEKEGNKIIQSLNYANTNIVDTYQLKGTNSKSKDDGGDKDGNDN